MTTTPATRRIPTSTTWRPPDVWGVGAGGSPLAPTSPSSIRCGGTERRADASNRGETNHARIGACEAALPSRRRATHPGYGGARRRLCRWRRRTGVDVLDPAEQPCDQQDDTGIAVRRLGWVGWCPDREPVFRLRGYQRLTCPHIDAAGGHHTHTVRADRDRDYDRPAAGTHLCHGRDAAAARKSAVTGPAVGRSRQLGRRGCHVHQHHAHRRFGHGHLPRQGGGLGHAHHHDRRVRR